VSDYFEVRVGTVVPHRDPDEGEKLAYLKAHELPVNDSYVPGALRRGHSGRRFQPPFVAVRRTSRPGQPQGRVQSTLITGPEPVIVENHLLVLLPHDGTLESCTRLMAELAASQTTAWLDHRLRCRHLTTTALREVPLSNWPEPQGTSRQVRS
jgi:hypothetical protein